MNYTDLQASIGRIQLKRQPEFSGIRLSIAKQYLEALQAIRPPLRFQKDILHPSHARHLFIIQVAEGRLSRDDLLLALRAQNVGASIHYAPLHLMPLYGAHGHTALPNTDQIGKRIMTLPISVSMKVDDVEYVVTQVKEFMA
jgi:dTDP-4-amino-4,6-dideoxygalactose transaminase